MKKALSLSFVLVALAACQTTSVYTPVSKTLPPLTLSFADRAWDGKKVPAGQHCKKFGGNGATPSLKISGIPSGTNAVIVEFNDASYAPLSANGGHGAIGFWINGGGEATLPAVPGGTMDMPDGVFLEANNRATGAWRSQGYLPPCSGGRGNNYFATIKAVHKAKADGEPSRLLAKGRIDLGKY